MQSNKVTLKRVANDIYPDWELEDWFKWPPNIFALISIVLHRTGSYKICLMATAWWEDKNWQENVESDAKKWNITTNNLLQDESAQFNLSDQYKILKKYTQIIKDNWDNFDINQLRILGDIYNEGGDTKQDKASKYAIALVAILSVADCCCAGIGLPGQTIGHDPQFNLLKGAANLLLTVTGSLSTFPKFYGVVLPKMRTPQSGIMLRSLSHHLTFHATEVEIVWRTFPWLHDSRQSLNLMVVPYPYKISKTDFTVIEENYYAARYFRGKIKNELDQEFLDGLVEEVSKKNASNNEIDILVFPEMSLTEKQYNYLLNKFAKSYNDNTAASLVSQLPIIISGVLHETPSDLGRNPSDHLFPVHNEVRIAIFFDGKWYDITQRKHHRWQMDRNQILQYELEGYFPTSRNWFELCSILQRRLTILVPNSWLALTALICEDLARQEPVTEVIRGIGPTLLTALLSDGPQIVSRWSARYASVLADDPGTAVLSLTSKGMAARAKKPESLDTTEQNDKKLAVGLWKDMVRGWKEMYLDEKKNALLFTISAKFEEEYTLDGRSDGANSSVFKMDSLNPKQIEIEYSKSSDIEEAESMIHPKNFGNWHDIRMLSTLLFLVDAITDLLCTQNHLRGIHILLDIIDPLLNQNRIEGTGFFSDIKRNILDSWKEPSKVGTAAINFEAKTLKNELKVHVEAIKEIIDAVEKERKSKGSFLELLVNVLEDRWKVNTESGTACKLFLYNIHTKLAGCKSLEDLNSKFAPNLNLTPADAMNLRKRILPLLSNSSSAR